MLHAPWWLGSQLISSTSQCLYYLYLAPTVGGRGCLHLEQHGKEDYWRSGPWFFDSAIIPLSRVATRQITGFVAVMWGLLPCLPLCQNTSDKKGEVVQQNIILLKIKWKSYLCILLLSFSSREKPLLRQAFSYCATFRNVIHLNYWDFKNVAFVHEFELPYLMV